MSQTNFNKMWMYNYYQRNPKFTMRGELLSKFPPVGTLICMHDEIDVSLKPLKMYPLRINWETGLTEHTVCYKPISSMIQDCNGCFEDFWGYKTEAFCKECLPYCI